MATTANLPLSPAEAIKPRSALITVVVLAEMLGCSERHIWRLNDLGKIPAPVRIGKLVRWVADEISDWLASGCPCRQVWEQTKPQRATARPRRLSN